MNRNRQTNPLKKRRMEKGLTQKHMSEKLGITQSQYSNIENGETDPTKYLKPIAEIFGLNQMKCLVVKFSKIWKRSLSTTQ